MTGLSFITNMVVVFIATFIGFWVLNLLKKNRHYNWMKYALPLLDISLINIIHYANAMDGNYILLITGTPVFFYFVFLVISVLRNSISSTVITGIYSAVSYAFFSFYGQIQLRMLDNNGSYFSNQYEKIINIAADDEIYKPFAILIVTGICAFIAARFNKMVSEQTRMEMEKDNVRRELAANLKEITQNILHTTDVLDSTSGKLSGQVENILDANRKIEGATRSEFEMIESSTSAVAELIRNVDSVSNSITKQADFVSESYKLIEEMSNSIESARDVSKKANDISIGLLSTAESGGNDVGEVMRAVREMEESSIKIQEVLNFILSIAEQTNMLAMNAAIESAHAGEAGKGFSIVAQEVRNIAEISSQNVEKIGGLLEDIRSKVNKIVNLASKTTDSFETILTDTRRTTSINSEVLSSMEKEYTFTHNVLKKIENLRIISEELKSAGQEQQAGGEEILKTITTMRDKANHVFAMTEQQTKNNIELSQIKTELLSIIAKDQEIMQKLENLVEKF